MSQQKVSKIPEYAKYFKREYQYVRGINKACAFVRNIVEDDDEFDENIKMDSVTLSNKLDILMKFIKRFLIAQENGKLKDITNFEFDYTDISNIEDFKTSLDYYFSILSVLYDWSRGLNDKSLVSRYERYKRDLKLFFSKINYNSDFICDSDTESCSDVETFCDSDCNSDCNSDSDCYPYPYPYMF